MISDIVAGHSPKTDGRPAVNGEVGVLKVSALSWGRFLAGENKALPKSFRVPPEARVRAGDLLISRANTVELVQSVKDRLPALEAGLPAGMKINIVNDASVSIKNAVSDVQFSLGLTIVLVVMVIFIFLRRVSATFGTAQSIFFCW